MSLSKLTFVFVAMFSAVSVAKDYDFPTIPNTYECKKETVVGTDDIPPTRTQALDNCFSYPATCLADFDNCKSKGISCSNLSPSDRYSVYDMMRLGIEPEKNLPANDRGTYKKISLNEGGSAFRSLENLIMHFRRAASEQCAPVDVFVSKSGSAKEQQKYQDEMWKKLEIYYRNQKKKAAGCRDCTAYDAQVTAAEFIKETDMRRTNLQLAEALAQDTFEEFLSKLLVPDKCIKPSQTLVFQDTSAKIMSWPEKAQSASKSQALQKLIDILGSKKKIAALQGICIVDPKPSSINDCSVPHSVVIHKYCEMCKPGGKDCKKAIQIQNSWGQSWQDANHDGWMDAEALLDRTGYKENYSTLVWIEGAGK